MNKDWNYSSNNNKKLGGEDNRQYEESTREGRCNGRRPAAAVVQQHNPMKLDKIRKKIGDHNLGLGLGLIGYWVMDRYT